MAGTRSTPCSMEDIEIERLRQAGREMELESVLELALSTKPHSAATKTSAGRR